jgi:putative NADH-flavin reductase
MQLIVFGASGSVGKKIVEQALVIGHTVTAFLRNPESFSERQDKNLEVVKGDVLNPASVETAMPHHDAVLCALGDGRKGIVRAEGTRNIIRAMEKNGIRRLICQTTLGSGESRGNLNFFWRTIMFGAFLKKAYLDHELQEKYIRQSHLDWTIVRPAAFTNGEATGKFKHGFSSSEKDLQLKISRNDLAIFMLQQLEDNTYLRRCPGISY